MGALQQLQLVAASVFEMKEATAQANKMQTNYYMLSACLLLVHDMQQLLWHRKAGPRTPAHAYCIVTPLLTGRCPAPQPCSMPTTSAAEALEQRPQEAARLEPLQQAFKFVGFPERRQVWIPPQLQSVGI